MKNNICVYDEVTGLDSLFPWDEPSKEDLVPLSIELKKD